MTPTGFDRDVWEGRKPLVSPAHGARTIGDKALADVGLEAWTNPELRRNSHDEPLGGIILEVDHRRVDDAATGEIRTVRSYRCYDPGAQWGQAFAVYGEDLIAELDTPDTSTLVRAIRRFCREVCDHSNRRRPSLLTGIEAQLLRDAAHLAAVVLGGTTP